MLHGAERGLAQQQAVGSEQLKRPAAQTSLAHQEGVRCAGQRLLGACWPGASPTTSQLPPLIKPPAGPYACQPVQHLLMAQVSRMTSSSGTMTAFLPASSSGQMGSCVSCHTSCHLGPAARTICGSKGAQGWRHGAQSVAASWAPWHSLSSMLPASLATASAKQQQPTNEAPEGLPQRLPPCSAGSSMARRCRSAGAQGQRWQTQAWTATWGRGRRRDGVQQKSWHQ